MKKIWWSWVYRSKQNQALWESGSILLSLQINLSLEWIQEPEMDLVLVSFAKGWENKVETAEFRLEHPQACFYKACVGWDLLLSDPETSGWAAIMWR